MGRGRGRRPSRRRSRSASCTRDLRSPRPRSTSESKIGFRLIEESIAPWLTEEQKKYIHPCGTSDTFLGLVLPTFAVSCSYDNLFQGGALLPDAYKLAYNRELVTGAVSVIICVSYMLVKIYEFPDLSPVQTLKSWIEFPVCPANFRIYRDTATVVAISYVLLLDINLSYLWLVIFPVIAITFIYALFLELCRHPGQEEAIINSVGSSKNGGRDEVDENASTTTAIAKEPEELELIVMAPFCALCALCVVAQLDSSHAGAADRFAVSQFLLFLSSTLGVLTRMMMRLPLPPAAGASPDVTPASELLHKTFLLMLLVTAHTLAAEALGEDMVLVCMPEIVPVLLWFLIHLDTDSSVVSSVFDSMKPRKNVLIAFGAVVVAPLLAYLATSLDESGLSRCSAVLLSSGVSGLLTYYLAFMLHQWPAGQQAAAAGIEDTNVTGPSTCIQASRKEGVGVRDNDGATSSSKHAVHVQSEEEEQAAGSPDEAVQLLKCWANVLLTVAAASLTLNYVVARRLGLQEPLLDTLCRNFPRLC